MKNKDLVILSNLRNNARESLTIMSKKTSIPISTLHDKLKQLKKSLIKRCTLILDYEKIGFQTRIFLSIKVDPADKKQISETLKKNINVNNIWQVNNGYDYLVDCIFKNLIDFEDFLSNLENGFRIKAKEYHIVLNELLAENFFSHPELIKYLCYR